MNSHEIDCTTLRTKRDQGDDFLLLDCREPDEYELVRIEGATLVPMSEMQERVGELDPHREREIVVYCHHGMRSLNVTLWLRQQGFAQVLSLAGGIDAWAQQVDPSLPRY